MRTLFSFERGKFNITYFGMGFLLILIPILALLHSSLFLDNYTVVKWLALYSSAAIMAILLSLRKSFYVPVLSTRQNAFLALLICGFIPTLLLGNSALFFQNFLDSLTFISLLISFFIFLKSDSEFIKKIQLISAFSSLACGLIGYLQLLGISILSTQSQGISSTFGNPNMIAQFLGVGILCIVACLERKNGYQNKLFQLLLIFVLTYVITLNCRSVLLSLGVVLIFSWKKLVIKKEVIICLLISIFLSKVLPFEHGHSTKNSLKDTVSMVRGIPLRAGTSFKRLEMWQGTIHLILDNPVLGVGPGEFEFDFIPYQRDKSNLPVSETTIFNSPHNEYLRIIAEYGLVFSAIFFFFLLYMVLNFWKRKEITRDDIFIRTLILFFSIEALFQFPLLNSFSFLFLSLILSYTLVKCLLFKEVVLKSIPRVGVVVFAILLLGLSSGRMISSYKEVNFRGYDDLILACNFFPSNWRACLSKAKLEIKNSQFEDAEKTINGVLLESPYNFPALHVASFLYWSLGDRLKSCELAERYVSIFDNTKSRLSEFYETYCNKSGRK